MFETRVNEYIAEMRECGDLMTVVTEEGYKETEMTINLTADRDRKNPDLYREFTNYLRKNTQVRYTACGTARYKRNGTVYIIKRG